MICPNCGGSVKPVCDDCRTVVLDEGDTIKLQVNDTVSRVSVSKRRYNAANNTITIVFKVKEILDA